MVWAACPPSIHAELIVSRDINAPNVEYRSDGSRDCTVPRTFGARGLRVRVLDARTPVHMPAIDQGLVRSIF
jgi:hypothetical protein